MDFDSVYERKAPLAVQDTQRVRTVLLGGNLILRAGLAHLLSGTGFDVLEGTFDGSPQSSDPPRDADLMVVVNIGRLASETSEIVEGLKNRRPGVRVVILEDHLDPNAIMLAYRAGADGYLLMTTGRDVLIKSLELIVLGERLFPSAILSKGEDSHQPAPTPQPREGVATAENLTPPQIGNLSKRELEILNCLAEGAQNKVIARNLNLAEATVKIHVKAILKKLGVQNRTQAAILATSYSS